jgi:DNA topoisomerase I
VEKDCASKTAARRAINRAIEAAADRLGNTRSVCRKCYIHPAILDAFLDGRTIALSRRRTQSPHALTPAESAVAALLRTRAT